MSPIFSRYKPRAPAKSFAVRTAFSWHSGQWSPLYSFASTGGVVHSQQHLEGLRSEVRENLRCVSVNYCPEYKGEAHRLTRLLEFINNAPVGALQ